jgi:hypothetical protein
MIVRQKPYKFNDYTLSYLHRPQLFFKQELIWDGQTDLRKLSERVNVALEDRSHSSGTHRSKEKKEKSSCQL